MAKINEPPPQAMWPWGGPRGVRERLIDRAQLERTKRLAKSGNPKSPALASAALLEFIGPAHTSEEMRLPLPPFPSGHDADLQSFLDRPYLHSVARRGDGSEPLEQSLPQVNAAPERLDRLRALLKREAQMLDTVGQVASQQQQILHLMWEAQKDEHL